jgi:hypothetical protein
MNKTVVIIFITLMLFSFSAFSQSAAHESRDINTEIIVKLKHDDVLSDVLSIINTERAGSVWLVKKITKSMPVFLLQFDDQKWEKNALLSRLKGLNTVRIAQANYAVEKGQNPMIPNSLHSGICKS